VSEFHELRQFSERVGKQQFGTVLDVGANVGETTRMFRRLWPQAHVYAIEPVQSTFEQLQRGVAGDSLVSCFRLALGEKTGPGRILSIPLKKMNHIVTSDHEVHGPVEDVPVETGARFCELNGIESIDFLKIDAEGFDLQVCKGFEPLLKEERVAALQVETTLQFHYRRLVPLPEFVGYLHPLGYRVFKAHAQIVARGQPMAKRCNVVFVSGKLIRENTTGRPATD
jgi:FkbM family methyltransferase